MFRGDMLCAELDVAVYCLFLRWLKQVILLGDVPLDLEYEKGIRWMPWHQEAMKDVARCEKPWGAASRL